MPPGLHAVLGASKASRWMACPGSIRLEDGLPDFKSEHAAIGTAAHEVAEMALQRGLPASFWEGEEVEGVLVTEEMADAVQVYVDYVRSAKGTGWLRLEEQVSLELLNPPSPMFGTTDAVIWNPATEVLHVVDYKHGQGVPVDAQGNPQLAYYALGTVLGLSVVPKEIVMTVVQPRAVHHLGPIRSWSITWDELRDFKDRLMAAAQATTRPDAPLAAGEHCRFCKAKPRCPAIKQLAVTTAQSEFDAFAPPAPALLSPAELQGVLVAAEPLLEWIKSVQAYALAALERGESVPGWKLVPKRANRKWADELAAQKWVEALDVEGEFYTTPTLRTPAQVEKELKKSKVQLPEELIVKESSGHNLAPDTDPRPAQVPSAIADFDIPVEFATTGG